jgi:competence protein ComEC
MAPLLIPFLALAVGVVFGITEKVGLVSATLSCCTGAVSAVLMNRGRNAALLIAFASVGAVGANAARLGRAAWRDRSQKLCALQSERISGVVVWVEGRPDDTFRLVLDDLVVADTEGRRMWAWPGEMEVYVLQPSVRPRVGDRVEVGGDVRCLVGKNRFERGRLGEGFVATAWVRHPGELVRRDAGCGGDGMIDRFLSHLRSLVEDALRTTRPGAGRKILWGMLLGPSKVVGHSLRESFARLGLAHVLVISGLHMTLLATLVFGLILALLRWVIGVGGVVAARQAAAWATLPVVWLFVAIAGACPATLRAAAMGSCVLVAVGTGRESSGLNALALGGGGLLVWRPGWLAHAGFQLSFVAVASLLWMAGEPRPKEDLAEDQEPGSDRLRRVKKVASTLFWASVVVTAATAPLVAHYFGRVAVAGVFANLVAVPLFLWVVLPLGLMGTAAFAMWPPAGELILSLGSRLAATFGDWVVWASEWAPHFGSPISIGWWRVFCLYVLLGCFAWHAKGRRSSRWTKRARACAAVLAATLFVVGAPFSEPSPRLRVTFLDLGGGESVLVELPDRRSILVDAGGGSLDGKPPVCRVVVPELRRRGVKRLDVVVLTHFHADHTGGLPGLLEEIEVGEVWIASEPTTHGAEPKAIRRVVEACRRHEVPIRRPRDLTASTVRVEVVHPLFGQGGQVGVDALLSANENSIVLRVSHPTASILLTGDIQEMGEAALLARGLAPVEVVKVAHHGSQGSSTTAFVRAASPCLAIVCGGDPSPLVEKRYEMVGSEILTTGRHGTIEISVDEKGVSVRKAQKETRGLPLRCKRSSVLSKQLIFPAISSLDRTYPLN